tara:strand:- start:22010 stop:22903 length:894 start_codon:yes stop_codon:yes gene_type:complete
VINIERIGLLSFMAVFVMGVKGCPSSHTLLEETQPEPVTSTLEKLVSEPNTIDFQSVSKEVFEPHCLSCHNNENQRGFVNLETYDANFGRTGHRKVVRAFDAEGSALYQSLIIPSGSRHMPPLRKQQLSELQIDLVKLWIENGAKLEVDQIVEPEPSEEEVLETYFENPETIDYNVINEMIFKPQCASCHSQESSNFIEDAILYGANMTSYDSLFSPFLPVIEKGNHRDSSLFESVVINQSMPPVEEGYQPLSGNLNRLLRLWIINCAIEDYNAIGEEELISDTDGIGKVRLCEDQM